MINSIFNFLSAEFILSNRPNGGDVIFIRSTIITVEISFLALLMVNANQLAVEMLMELPIYLDFISERTVWIGAIFVVCYTALYSRSSAQVSYISDLYNRIMEISVCTPSGYIDHENFNILKAGFVEDAITLHLARKDIFAPTVLNFLKDSEVRTMLLSSSPFSSKTICQLEFQLSKYWNE